MAWTWAYESADGSPVTPQGVAAAEQFPSQADAETWIGESYGELFEAGVHAATLFDGDRKVYGPMGLGPA